MQAVWALVRMVRMVYDNIMFMYIFMKQWKYKAFISIVWMGYLFKQNDDIAQLSQEQFCSW